MLNEMDAGLPRNAIQPTSSRLAWADRSDHFLARCGIRRGRHRVEPGLYALGSPTADAPVFATANYTLSFDALRSALDGIDGHILVLDTKGINVWCAAGKGTFGTDELVRSIEDTRLSDVVRHRSVILPQLGAPGVAAHEVAARSGFAVDYGPVRAADLPDYLRSGHATPEMRRVRFSLSDRLVLIPVELRLPLLLLLAAILIQVSGVMIAGWAVWGMVAAVWAGTVAFPILMPWLPTHEFGSKGLILGAAVAVPFAWWGFSVTAGADTWLRIGQAMALMLLMPPATTFLALMFTGSTTFASRTGVKREVSRYVPIMGGMAVVGLALAVGLIVSRFVGGGAS